MRQRKPEPGKLPTPPGEELAEVLYNTAGDFFVPSMERLELVFYPVLEWMFMLYSPSRLKGDVKALPPKAIS